MKILPITNTTNNNISNKGCVSPKLAELTKNMSDGWLRTAQSGKYTKLPIINACLYSSERINDIFINLSTMMERFAHGCELTFEKSLKTGKHRFFIEHKYSNYKTLCGDIEFSKDINKITDVYELESLEGKVAKIDPYKENTNFIIQRKTDAKSVDLDREFEPDADYTFIEDKLIRKEVNDASMEDIHEYLEAAKEEGLIDG